MLKYFGNFSAFSHQVRIFFARFTVSHTIIMIFGGMVYLSACAPIDQRTFNPNAGKPPAVPKPVSVPHNPADDQPPFLQIIQDTPEEDYGQAIDSAVKLALKRKRNILFIVRGVAPMQPTPQQQTEILTKLTQDLLTPVAKRILAAGAKPIQIDMQVATLPTLHQAMVQVNVR